MTFLLCSHATLFFLSLLSFFFFFNDTATTEIYTLSLHDALPISMGARQVPGAGHVLEAPNGLKPTSIYLYEASVTGTDRKSTRLNSSHSQISYAVFCLKKKKKRCDDISLPLPLRELFTSRVPLSA